MRQAIVTTYHGPTNTRDARVSARAEAGRLSLPWDHSLNVEQNHAAAARAFAEKYGWAGLWVGGGLPGAGCCYVNTAEGDTGNGWPSGTAFEIDAREG